ncbi:hypothetical protein OIU74_023763 [Salix koriyanagi]|uniref:Uncharacterized protein n=1 Tax=Salix koriyanagi TaxID=2511006 RepID=A0A9Q1ABG8_9ROSI|nr:hypothetical protein OIU74_023763 [Salix koriyanagi]
MNLKTSCGSSALAKNQIFAPILHSKDPLWIAPVQITNQLCHGRILTEMKSFQIWRVDIKSICKNPFPLELGTFIITHQLSLPKRNFLSRCFHWLKRCWQLVENGSF